MHRYREQLQDLIKYLSHKTSYRNSCLHLTKFSTGRKSEAFLKTTLNYLCTDYFIFRHFKL